MHPSKNELFDYDFNPLSGCLADCQFCNVLVRGEQFGGDIRLNMADPQYWVPGKERLFMLEEPFKTPDGRSLIHPFGFAPTFHRYRLDLPAKTPAGHNFGVCTVGDLFAPWVPTTWIRDVLDACTAAPQHNYIFSTRYPGRLEELDCMALLPRGDRFWYGTTITAPGEAVPGPAKYHTFLNIDPLVAPLRETDLPPCDLVVIGTGAAKGKQRYRPEPEWVQSIVSTCLVRNTAVFMRDSLRGLMGVGFRQELPAALTHKPLSPLRKEQLYARCGFCKTELKKSDMTAMIFRKGRRGASTTDAYSCDGCLGHLRALLNGPLPVKGLVLMSKGRKQSERLGKL